MSDTEATASKLLRNAGANVSMSRCGLTVRFNRAPFKKMNADSFSDVLSIDRSRSIEISIDNNILLPYLRLDALAASLQSGV